VKASGEWYRALIAAHRDSGVEAAAQ